MVGFILDCLFGCWHKRYSFPITSRPAQGRSEAASVTGTYVVCLDCGKEFPYDWRAMKVVAMPRKRSARMPETAEESLARTA